MFCPACDTRHPSTANFCMHCGIPLRESAAARAEITDEIAVPREARYEFQDLAVPLHFTSEGLRDDQVVERYREVITDHLATAARSGWEPDGSLDFQTLWTDGRIQWRALDTAEPACAFDTVTIRVKRPAF